jgi:hypothetical protein
MNPSTLVISGDIREYSDRKFKPRERQQGEQISQQHVLIGRLEYVKPSELYGDADRKVKPGRDSAQKVIIFIHTNQSTDRISIETRHSAWKKCIERPCGLGEPAVVLESLPFTLHHHR